MALTQLGNSNIYVDADKISAKTSVKKVYNKDKWEFKVLVDGKWVTLQYDSETDANSAWAII